MSISVKVSGTWREVKETYVKVSGTWRTQGVMSVRVSGSWRSVGPSYYDIPAGTYTEKQLVDLIRGYVPDNATRSLVSPISFRIYDSTGGSTSGSVKRYWRNVTVIYDKAVSSGGQDPKGSSITFTGETSTNGSTWTALTASGSYTWFYALSTQIFYHSNTGNADTLWTVVLDSNITFA